jgi:hypothetical protein
MGTTNIMPAITRSVNPDRSPRSQSCLTRKSLNAHKTTAARIQASSPTRYVASALGRITAMWSFAASAKVEGRRGGLSSSALRGSCGVHCG